MNLNEECLLEFLTVPKRQPVQNNTIQKPHQPEKAGMSWVSLPSRSNVSGDNQPIQD